jgi:hypothetical protein
MLGHRLLHSLPAERRGGSIKRWVTAWPGDF